MFLAGFNWMNWDTGSLELCLYLTRILSINLTFLISLKLEAEALRVQSLSVIPGFHLCVQIFNVSLSEELAFRF